MYKNKPLMLIVLVACFYPTNLIEKQLLKTGGFSKLFEKIYINQVEQNFVENIDVLNITIKVKNTTKKP